MARLWTTVLPSLAAIPDDELDEITADGRQFADRPWLRLLEDLDLPRVAGGRLELGFVVAFCGATPVAVCPLLRARGEGLHFLYSIRQFYFEHWIEEAVRLSPDRRADFTRRMSAVSAYRTVLETTGSTLDDCLLVVQPFSYRGTIAVSPSSPVAREEVFAAVLEKLTAQARRRRIPLWIQGVEAEDARFLRFLEGMGLSKTFLLHDNRIRLEGFDRFDGYLRSFRRTTRRAFERDIRRTREAGIEFSFTSDLSGFADEFAAMYHHTYAKYGQGYFRHPPEFWSALGRRLGPKAEAIVARQGGRLIGFSVLLKNRRRGELWTYRIGRTADPSLDRVPYYFCLSFYGPIRRAIELGYRRIWLGPAAYQTKRLRGAELVPVYSYFYLPRRMDRWLLAPYLRLFGNVSREQIERASVGAERPRGAASATPAPTLEDRE